MPYYEGFADKARIIGEWLDLKHEQGAATADAAARRVHGELDRMIAELEAIPVDKHTAAREPDDLQGIRALRPDGPRVLDLDLSPAQLEDRILGAWLGRAAGCTLGIPCEGFNREQIIAACDALSIPYPLEDYWPVDPKPADSLTECNGLPRHHLLAPYIHRVMPDDDLLYTLLDLLILEEYGPGFTSDDVGRAWLRWLPFGCTAEAIALENLRRGLHPPDTALLGNPCCEWLGADIRSDGWAYAAPGLPELAAEFAWRDSRVSHTRNGIYGAMFFSAAISAAFATGDVRRAIEIGLSEIPTTSRLYEGLLQTIDWCDTHHDHDRAVDLILGKYAGMHVGHTINCACVTVAGLLFGEGDFERTISWTCCSGRDTDCTTATAGSLFGAAVGARALPAKWIDPLGRITRTYINDNYVFTNRDIARRFRRVAEGIRGALADARG